MAYEDLDPADRAVVDAVLQQKGINPTTTTPRKNGRGLDSFNDQLRQSPIWIDFMTRNGFDVVGRPGLVPKLSDKQRKAFQAELTRNGMQFGKGMAVDPAGNVNQDQKLGKKIAIGAAIGGMALTGLGAAGIGPMAGLLGGAGAAGSAGAAGASAAGAGAGAAGAGGVLASSSLPAAALMGGPAAITSMGASGALGAAGAASGGARMLGKLAGLAKNPDTWRAGGAMLGAASQASADQRAAEIEASLIEEQLRQNAERDYNDAVLAREKEGRESGKDALRSMQHTAYIAGGGNEFTPRDGMKSFGFGPKAATDAEKQGAAAFQAEVMKRLEGGNAIPMPTRRDFVIDKRKLRAGGAEKALGYGGVALDFLDFIR